MKSTDDDTGRAYRAAFQTMLREVLRADGRTRHQIATSAGMDPSYLTRLMKMSPKWSDGRLPSREWIERLARGLALTDDVRCRLLIAAGYFPGGWTWSQALQDLAEVTAEPLTGEDAEVLLMLAHRLHAAKAMPGPQVVANVGPSCIDCGRTFFAPWQYERLGKLLRYRCRVGQRCRGATYVARTAPAQPDALDRARVANGTYW